MKDSIKALENAFTNTTMKESVKALKNAFTNTTMKDSATVEANKTMMILILTLNNS